MTVTQTFFVYGTLKRGQCRQDCWPRDPISITPAKIKASLFGRHDYPAILEGNDWVAGECWKFRENDVGAVLRVLDEIEGTQGNSPDDLYHRQSVEVFEITGYSLGIAHCYFYNGDPIRDGFARIAQGEDFCHWPPTGRFI